MVSPYVKRYKNTTAYRRKVNLYFLREFVKIPFGSPLLEGVEKKSFQNKNKKLLSKLFIS